MADAGDESNLVSEPLDLVRLLLDEVVFVKLRGDRELKGKLYVRQNHISFSLVLWPLGRERFGIKMANACGFVGLRQPLQHRPRRCRGDDICRR